ncbi:MAG: YCF48-related protein [Deltaproteobacteria bacterium]|nr:YCF48-related protein [Deltaproteobacteria bacterium]
MIPNSSLFHFSATAIALLGLAALLFPQPTPGLGRRANQAQVIVHGHRASEKPYRSPYDKDRWRVIESGIDDDLTALWAVDGEHAWVGGVSGGVYRTRDAGRSWEALVGVDLGRFVQLDWKGPDRGFALATDGEILRTDDGGGTWKSVRAASSDRVLHLDFVDEEKGWAVGQRGLLLHTIDGGSTWARYEEAVSGDLTVVQMLSEKTGWAGGPGLLLGTRDAGTSWVALEDAPGWWFVSGRRGYATDGKSIFATDDGGESWRPVRALEHLLEFDGGPDGASYISHVRFVDRYNGLAEVMDGGTQRLFRTRSLGRFWKQAYKARRGEGAELVSFSMSDGRNGLALDGNGNLRATRDGARTWPVQIGGEFFDLTDVHFADPQRGWAVGRAGRILVTEDGGKRWREGSRRFDSPLRRVQSVLLSPESARAWAAGGGGTVLASISEGHPWRSPWRSQRTTTREDILDLAFQDSSRGAAAGENGLLMTTADGGDSWIRRSTGISGAIVAVALVERNALWAATASTIYRSGNDGQSLTAASLPSGLGAGSFVDLAAPAPEHLLALQAEGRLLRTRNGGEAWDRVVVDPDARLRALQFVDAAHGWVLGRKEGSPDLLYITETAGAEWQAIELPARDVRASFFADPKRGWLAGPQSIHVTTDGGRNWRRQVIGPSRFLRAFVQLDDGGAWAAGDNGLVARYPPMQVRGAPADENEEGAAGTAPSTDD